MSDTPPQETAPAAAPVPGSVAASPIATSPLAGNSIAASPVLAWVALLIALAAFALAGWLAFDTRERDRDLKTEVSRQLATAGKDIDKAVLLAGNADKAGQSAVEQLAYLGKQFASTQQQQVAIEALYKTMAESRDNWTLAEIEPMLTSAAQQLQLAGNVRAAIVALETIDARLAQSELPQFTNLRRAVAADLARLRATPVIDEVGLVARVEALAGQILALAPAGVSRTTNKPRPQASAGSVFRELLAELENLIAIRRIDSNESVLLQPSQAYFLRENLRLRLLSARLAVLAHDPVSWRADLTETRRLLRSHFDVSDAAVAAALRELDKLAGLDIAPPLPDLDASLEALADYRAAH